MRYYQEIMVQTLSSLSIDHPPVTNPSFNHSSDFSQATEDFTASYNAVKSLAKQIPYFNRSDEENVELLLEKLESLAQIHGSSSNVVLTATSSKLAKTARK